jgi:hypothetical protein
MGSRERTRVEDIERASGGRVLGAQAEGCRQMTAAAGTGHQNKKPPPPATTLTGQEAQATTSPRQLPLPQGAPHTAPQAPSMQNTSTTKESQQYAETHQTATGQPAGHTARPPRDASSLPLLFLSGSASNAGPMMTSSSGSTICSHRDRRLQVDRASLRSMSLQVYGYMTVMVIQDGPT